MSEVKKEVCHKMEAIPKLFEKHFYKIDNDTQNNCSGYILSPTELLRFNSKKDTL